MMMAKGTVNSSGEGDPYVQKFLLCGLGASASPPRRSLLLQQHRRQEGL